MQIDSIFRELASMREEVAEEQEEPALFDLTLRLWTDGGSQFQSENHPPYCKQP